MSFNYEFLRFFMTELFFQHDQVKHLYISCIYFIMNEYIDGRILFVEQF
jgi:hypothetical protein